MKLTHINCADPYCRTCLDEHLALGNYLDFMLRDTVDHLGKFHKWLSDRGIEPETEYGWGSMAYFDDENIQGYIEFVRNNDNCKSKDES